MDSKGLMRDLADIYKNEVLGDSKSDLSEAVLQDRDYEIKNGKIYISKKNYSKVHKDYKGKDNGKPMMMAMGPKGTTLFPVEFTD